MKDILQQLQSRIDKLANEIADTETTPNDLSKDAWKAVREAQTLNKRLYGEITLLRRANKSIIKVMRRNVQLSNGLQLAWENTDEN